MSKLVKKVVIVGGGSAGWLCAGLIAAEHSSDKDSGIEIVVIESPDVRPIGVGEGTWPTMRTTLKKIGISETDFLMQCDASFKQGSKFCGWVTGKEDDCYYHPFTIPHKYNNINLAEAWHTQQRHVPYADAVSFQSHLCEQGLAPKQITTPEYEFFANYGYHLDAGKFATILQKHCVDKLGVSHILDHVVEIKSAENGDIDSLETKSNGSIEGDLFVDCTGSRSLLLGEHMGIPFVSRKDTLFIDSALAIQVPYNTPDSPIASQTLSTAQDNGWIWDIGLQSRRGVGHVFSSAHTDAEKAEEKLRQYLDLNPGDMKNATEIRKIQFEPGHRQKFWHRNCVAVGMAAGFLEPLEASALVMVEQSAAMISEQLPANRDVMDITAKRFNQTFLYHWDRVVEFLKLHYILSQRRDTDFWIDNCRPNSIPDNLQDMMQQWKFQAPWHHDLPRVDELFPTASFQYVLYGMGFTTQFHSTRRQTNYETQSQQCFKENANKVQQLQGALQSNRSLLEKIREFGLQEI